MIRRSSLGCTFLTAFASFLFPLAGQAHIEEFATGTLIRGSDSAVYYITADRKRAVFPTSQTYFSWYTDFSKVQDADAETLASYPLGGNITYRPGMRLLKINTDPRVYAVAAGGVIRWVQSESVAASIFGPNWNTQIDDVPDVFFINYRVGLPISSSLDYSADTEKSQSNTIEADRAARLLPPLPPSPTPTPTTTTPTTTPAFDFTFTTSKSVIHPGDLVELAAYNYSASNIERILLFLNADLLNTCFSRSCTKEAAIPLSSSLSTYVAKAIVRTIEQKEYIKEILIPVDINQSGLVKLSIGRAQIKPGTSASVVVEADASIAVNRIDISVDNQLVKGCVGGTRLCQWADILNGPIGKVFPIAAIVTDTYGRTYKTNGLTITLSENDSPSVTIESGLSAIRRGESIDITVHATDDDGIASQQVLKTDGTVLKTCDYASACTVITGPWSATGTISFYGKAVDPKGTSATTSPITVTVNP